MGPGGAGGWRQGGVRAARAAYRVAMPMADSAARIGVLLTGDASHPNHTALCEGLAALGRIDGKDIAIEARFCQDQLARQGRV